MRVLERMLNKQLRIYENGKRVAKPTKNDIIGSLPMNSLQTEIHFDGVGSVLYLDPKAKFTNSRLSLGSNSLAYLSASNYKLNIDVNSGGTLFIGNKVYFNGRLNGSTSERCNIIIGDECLFSFDIWLRCSDPHLIYDADTNKRVNPSKSIVIGDHVWVGQHAMLLKGTRVGSGSIIGAMSLVAGKHIPSNVIYAGNPAKQIRENVFFTSGCVHHFSREETAKAEVYPSKEWVYREPPDMDIDALDCELSDTVDAHRRLQILQERFIQRRSRDSLALQR